MADNSSGLADDIVPDEPQHTPLERNFAPWHKVRKEFVRRKQWNALIVRYAKRFLHRDLQPAMGGGEWSADTDVEIPESIRIDRPLNCLVIPGDDILDIRSLHRDTESIDCFIRYLGFNARQGSDQTNTRVHVANNDLTSLRRVSAESIVTHDSFQSVAKKNSQAMQYVRSFGPFHVVNLDLCDSLFPKKDAKFQEHYDGLLAITAYQMTEMAAPWLLFVTTEVSPHEVDASLFDKLCEPTKTNLKHPEFKKALSGVIPIESLTSKEQVDLSLLNEKQLVDLFGVAIGKALLSFCPKDQATWKLEMRGSHIYTINPKTDVSMMSLAFQFSPIKQPPQDVTGLSSLDLKPPKPFDEASLATKLVASVEKISDIDAILEGDPDLQKSLLYSSADLLRSAGFDRDAYIDWVAAGETTYRS